MTTSTTAAPVFLRVEKGAPDLVELAVLTVVLVDRLTATADAERPPVRATAAWRSPGSAAGVPTPRSWRHG